MTIDESSEAGKVMKCEDIQELLFDYMTRELGQNRSDLVREHLRKCEKCRAAAAEVQTTLELLKTASRTQADVPEHLSDKHRARLRRSIKHPFIAWIEHHHIIVSVIIAGLVIATVLLAVRRMKLREEEEPLEGIPVTIRHARPDGSETNKGME
ncbi:MAG: zf-HC2 domain-containing protein [Kiritimatiellia bacterium]